MICDNCAGSGHHLCATIAKLRGKAIAFVECIPCLGFGAMPLTIRGPATIRSHAADRPYGAQEQEAVL